MTAKRGDHILSSRTIYTIGYSGYSLDDPAAGNSFIAALRKIAPHPVVIDVRSEPHSAYFAQYNKENLEKQLKAAGIYYRNYKNEFGARQEDKSVLLDTGYLDFEKFVQTPAFKSGINKIVLSMEKGFVFALMCAEKNPADCHRAVMIGRTFQEAGYEVRHLMPDGTIKTQTDVEDELLSRHCKAWKTDAAQISLFDVPRTREDYLVEAYRKQNELMGREYRKQMDAAAERPQNN